MANPIGLILEKQRETDARLSRIEDMLEQSLYSSGYFRAFDARDYIRYPLSEYEKIWCYRGNYYHIKKDLYEEIKSNNEINITYEVFLRKFADDEELWKYKVNTVYLAKLTIPYYISSDGVFFTKNYRPLSTIGFGGETKIITEGTEHHLRNGYYAYKKFINKDYQHPQHNIFYLVPGFRNSRIDVLSPHQDAAAISEIE